MSTVERLFWVICLCATNKYLGLAAGFLALVAWLTDHRSKRGRS